MMSTQFTEATFLAETANLAETVPAETANPSPATEPAVSAGATPSRRSGRATAKRDYADMNKAGLQSDEDLFAKAVAVRVRKDSRQRIAAAAAATQAADEFSMEATPGVNYPVATDVDGHDALALGEEFAELHGCMGQVRADPSPANLAALEACWKRLCSHVRATEAEATSGPEERAKALAANRAKRARREAAAAAEGARPAAVEAAAQAAEAAELRRQFEEKKREMEAQRRTTEASLRQAEEAAAEAARAAEAERLAEERAKLEAEQAERQTRAAKQALEERAAALAAEVARLEQGGGRRGRAPVTASSRAWKARLARNNKARKEFEADKESRYKELDCRCRALEGYLQADFEGSFQEWLATAQSSAEEVTVREDPQPEFDRKLQASEDKYQREMQRAEAAEEEGEEAEDAD